MNQRLLVFVLFFVLRLTELPAQLGFSIPITSNAQVGSVLDLPVIVTGFDSIIAAQFVVRWDPSVLQFQSVDQFNLPDLNDSKFGTNHALDSGIVRFAWVFVTNGGTSLPNGTAIFHIKLKVVGPINSGTPLALTQLPPFTYFEIVLANDQVLDLNDVTLNFGFVAVGYTYSGTHDILSPASIRVSPNPFSEKTILSFDLAAAAHLRVRIADASGRTVFERDEHFPAGRAGMEIASTILDRQGIYFLIIQSESFSHATPLVFSE